MVRTNALNFCFAKIYGLYKSYPLFLSSIIVENDKRACVSIKATHYAVYKCVNGVC